MKARALEISVSASFLREQQDMKRQKGQRIMKKQSKFLAAALICVMGISLLAGCGKSGSGSGAAASETVSQGELTLEAIKEKGKLVVATEAAYEPFEYLDGDKIIGYDADIFQKICDDLGVELDYQDMPFQGILAGLEAKKYDVAGACLGITAERAEKYSMTYPIQEGTTVLIKRKSDDSIQSVEDMEGKIVGTQTSCYNEPDVKAYSETLIANGGKGMTDLKTYDSFPEAYMELKNGTIDLVAQGYAQSATLVKNNPDDYEIVGNIGGKTYLGWAVRKEDSELYDYINAEIAKFEEDGTLAELQKKWFGETVELPQSDYIPAE